MKLIIEKFPDLKVLYEKQLRLLLSAEEMSAIKLGLFEDSATDAELRQAVRDHKRETDGHAARVRELLARTDSGADPLKCKVINALFDEAEDLIEDTSHEAVRDALIISAAH